MNIGDLVKVQGSHGWATHRVVEGSEKCPLYVKRLSDGTLSPLARKDGAASPYVVVESRERQAERMILGYEEFIPVLSITIDKRSSMTLLDSATFAVEEGEGVFNLKMPGQATFQYYFANGVYLQDKQMYQASFQGGMNLLQGDTVQLISLGAKPKTRVRFELMMKDSKATHHWKSECTMD